MWVCWGQAGEPGGNDKLIHLAKHLYIAPPLTTSSPSLCMISLYISFVLGSRPTSSSQKIHNPSYDTTNMNNDVMHYYISKLIG